MTHDIRKKFGDRVRKLRRQQGYSQESLADAANMHRTYVGAIERGEQNISIENIQKLARTLKVSLSELFNGL